MTSCEVGGRGGRVPRLNWGKLCTSINREGKLNIGREWWREGRDE